MDQIQITDLCMCHSVRYLIFRATSRLCLKIPVHNLATGHLQHIPGSISEPFGEAIAFIMAISPTSKTARMDCYATDRYTPRQLVQ